MAVSLLVLLLGLGCSGAPSPVPDVTAADGVSTQRVAVIDPGVHELLIRLEATDKMVGRPDYTDEFEQTKHLPTLGTGLGPSYEQIVRTGPDLILTTHASRGTVLDNLRKIAPTPQLPWLTVDEVVSSIREIGGLIDEVDDANAMADRMAAELAPSVSADAPKVLVLLSPPSASDTELWVIKPNSLHGAALQAAGGHHAIPQAIVGPPTLSIEGLLQIDPDIIIVLIADMGTTEQRLAEHRGFWERFGMLKAVKNDRIGFMVGRTHFYTGPGVMDFKSALQAKITEVQAR